MGDIWNQVKENSERLRDCPGPHEFAPIEKRFGSKWRCAKCGGISRGPEVSWYMTGFAHGLNLESRIAGLKERHDWLRERGRHDEADRLCAEMDALEEEARKAMGKANV